jgi:ABC-type uncharacterized transport system ATPase subunit
VLRVAPGVEAVRAVLDRVPGATFVATDQDSVDYAVPANTDFSAVLRSLVGAADIHRFDAIEPSLHDIYIKTIGEAA